MRPQPPRQIRPQNNQTSPTSGPFLAHNSAFDPSTTQTLDPNAPAKLDPVNAANLQRQLASTNMRPPVASTSHIPVGGSTQTSFAGATSSSYNPPNSLPGAPTDAANNVQFSPASLSGPSPAYFSHHNAALQSAPPPFDASLQATTGPSRQQMMNSTTLKQRQRFFNGLANIHISRGHPLPPALTGVSYPPNYDPANSPWKNIECSSNEVGVFRLAGKDIDLLKLWGTVLPLGGGAKVSQQNAWPQILHQFDLPEFLPVSLPNGQRSVATVLSNYYSAILHPFEEFYRRNLQSQDNNRKAMTSAGRPSGSLAPNSAFNMSHQAPAQSGTSQTIGAVNNAMGLLNQSVPGNQQPSVPFNGSSSAAVRQQSPKSPHANQVAPNTTASGSFMDGFIGHTLVQSSGGAIGQQPVNVGDEQHERDAPSVKRRLGSEEVDGKRAKLKTGGSELPDSLAPMSATTERSLIPNTSNSTPTVASSGPQSNFMRTKVEYIPLAREVDTFGGRDLNILEEEYQRAQRRPMRDINEWGTVDIEALTMSIRSRLAAELSYALTTFTLLSTMKGPTPGSGFPISQCTDLFEEVLDLLEDEAFDGLPDTPQHRLAENTPILRHRELVALTYDAESLPFAGLNEGYLQKTPGPGHRSGIIILAVINIIRNLTVIPDNVPFLAKHERMLELVLRTCDIVLPGDGSPPRAASLALTLTDVIHVRRDVLYTLCNLSSMISFPSASPSHSIARIATRIFELMASVLIEPTDAVSPVQVMKVCGVPFQNCKPPSLPDVALDVFTRIAHLDQNRQVFSAVIPQGWIWRLLETLVYRLPVLDPDFAFLNREAWLSYLEKATMAIYALAFLSPPELKRRIKSDRQLCFSQVMLRMAQRLVTSTTLPEARPWFMVTARRAVEALKVVDDEEDAFDTSQSTQPTLAFGMGFGETGETTVEKGTGILAGRRDLAWELLMQRDLDPVMFAELESLMRVE
ncbi:hypothetical protein F5I97DRAFT_1929969 [Phlebopus sp. FC_14]|nr:hypothetical protein F5I97DRAFT_1929969 [Phlebopus sp. FC_14]